MQLRQLSGAPKFGLQRAASHVASASMISKLFGGGASSPTKQHKQHKQLWFNDASPSWDELTNMVKSKQAALGLDFWQDPEHAPTNPTALKRTFGQNGPIRVKLYRDHAAWCPYCQKVWLQLEEKRIPYTMEKVNMRCYGDKQRSFLAKVPNGLLPVIELDGQVVTESSVIMQLLEEAFPDHTPLMPPRGTPSRMRAEQLMRLERRLFGDWLGWLTSDWSHDSNKARFVAVMDAVEKELQAAGGPFFLGAKLSLVDITFVPMLERIAASIAYYKGLYVRGSGRWPAVERWFNALELRPTLLGTKSDYYTHCHDLPPQLGGCAMTAEGVPVSQLIDGTAPGAWQLPLPPLSASSLPEPYSPGENPAADTLEAAAAMVKNHAALVRFALRGPGQPGPRPVSAPLADPTAIPAEEWTAAGDAALRHVAHALIVGVQAKQVSQQALQVTATQPAGAAAQLQAGPVVQAAEYLRDRVGVPRDMKFPAARQLRAHLNWLIGTLTP
ncbi:glutathione S-transferase [Haematococcus lacustris]